MKSFNVYKIDDDLYVNQLRPKDYLAKIKTHFSQNIDNAKFKNNEINELFNWSIPLKSTTNWFYFPKTGTIFIVKNQELINLIHLFLYII